MKKQQFFKPYEVDSVTLKKMQTKLLEMLLVFQQFCEKYNLRFYLIGGAAIGAVREHGFIPWDDDIDVIMPRPDYDKFHELWPIYGDEKYLLCKTNEKVNYHHSSSSLRDPQTTFICKYNQYSDICHGIALEFGPIHATPDSKILQFIQICWGGIFALFNNQRLPNNTGRFIREATKIAYFLIPSKRIQDRIWMLAEREMSKYSWKNCIYVKELWGKTSFYNFPKEWFDTAVYFNFEGYKMPLMAGYHEYLSLIFGDYMKRPPIPERIVKHDLIFVDMDHPYTDYKGIYYSPEGK